MFHGPSNREISFLKSATPFRAFEEWNRKKMWTHILRDGMQQTAVGNVGVETTDRLAERHALCNNDNL